ncbi:hypothetical protein BKA62DRAFT_802336 [Auriculariales sp. MPI-PUGE-AT-0066]|nr:hypothetical protein BKA62DRAFT_802336 [Auriculariales sp. MPI-PUGE-AT-0066]
MSSITFSGIVELDTGVRRGILSSPTKGSSTGKTSSYDFYDIPLHTWEFDTSANAPYALMASLRHYPAKPKDVFFDKQYFDGMSPPPHLTAYTYSTTSTFEDGRFAQVFGSLYAGVPVDGPEKLLMDARKVEPFPGEIDEAYIEHFSTNSYLNVVVIGTVVGTRKTIPGTSYLAQVIIVSDDYVCGEKRTSRVIAVFDSSSPRFKTMREIPAHTAVQVSGSVVGVLDECLAVLADNYILGIGSKAAEARDPLQVANPKPVATKRQRHSTATRRIKEELDGPALHEKHLGASTPHRLEELAPVESTSKLPETAEVEEDANDDHEDQVPGEEVDGGNRKRQRRR